MIEAARSVLNRYIPDIYLYSDVYKGEESGKWVASICLPLVYSHLHKVARVCLDPACGVHNRGNALR